MKETTERVGTSQSKLLSAVVSLLTDTEIKDLLARLAALENLETEILTKASEDVLRHVRGKSAKDIQSMADAAAKVVVQR